MNLETSFCMESGQVKTGEDKDDTFVKMLQEVVRVTPPIAFGIASEYSSVIALVQAFRRHGPLILEDLQVGYSSHVCDNIPTHESGPEICQPKWSGHRPKNRSCNQQAIVQSFHGVRPCIDGRVIPKLDIPLVLRSPYGFCLAL